MSMSTTRHIHASVSGGPHRAVVTHANDQTGEVRVIIPALFGVNELTLSLIARNPSTNGWSVPAVGDQIIVGTDDQTFTNVFWIQSDGTSKLEERIATLEAQVAAILGSM